MKMPNAEHFRATSYNPEGRVLEGLESVEVGGRIEGFVDDGEDLLLLAPARLLLFHRSSHRSPQTLTKKQNSQQVQSFSLFWLEKKLYYGVRKLASRAMVSH